MREDLKYSPPFAHGCGVRGPERDDPTHCGLRRGRAACRCTARALRAPRRTAALSGLPGRARVGSLADALANVRVVVHPCAGKQDQNGQEKHQRRGLTSKSPARV